MRLLIAILLFISLQSQGQIIRANAFYKPPVSGCSYLLDQYSGAAAAYSLRKVRCAYSGSLIRVRRSSDNTESDIGATINGDLDTAALKTFVGTGGSDDGFVVTWYDQSGNARNFTQSTAGSQPLIIDNGVIFRDAGSIYISTATGKTMSSSFTLNQPYSIYIACTIPDAVSGWRHIFDGSNGSDGVPGIMYQTAITQQSLIYAGTVLGDNTIRTGRALTATAFNGSSSNFYYNNTLVASGNAGTGSIQTIFIGRNWNGTLSPAQKQYEIIIWSSDQSSNRTGIQNNINSYYSIY